MLSIKYSAFIWINLFCFKIVLGVVTEEGMREWQIIAIEKCKDDCIHLVSEETQELWEDDNSYENAETRSYALCTLQHMGYIVSGDIKVDNLVHDFQRYVPGVNPADARLARTMITICKEETERDSPDHKDETIAGRWAKCMADRAKTPEIFADYEDENKQE